MKKITLEKVYQSLLGEVGEIILSDDVIKNAANSLKRMMEANA
jgi:quinolinate synthase